MAKQRRYREKTADLLKVLDRAIQFSKQDLIPSFGFASKDEGMSHRRSKNNVLVDCINAVKAAKEANLARQANEGSASAQGSSFGGGAEAREEDCGPRTFKDILTSSQSFFGVVVLRPDGAIAGMNPSLSKLLPPIRAVDRHCYVMQCPTAVWFQSDMGPRVAEVHLSQISVTIAQKPPVWQPVSASELRTVVVLMSPQPTMPTFGLPQQAMPFMMPGGVDMQKNLLLQLYNGMPSSLQSGVPTAAATPLGGLGDWGCSRAVAAGAAAPNRMMAQPGFGNFMPSNVEFSSSSSSAAAAAAQGQGTNTAPLDSALSLSRIPSTGAKSMASTGAALSAGDAEQAHASAIASWAGGATGAGFTTMADKLRLMTPKDQLGLMTGTQMAQLDDGRNQPITSQPLANSFDSSSDATRDLKASASATSAATAVGAGNLASGLAASKLDGQGAGAAQAALGAVPMGASNNSSAGAVSALPGGGDAPSNAAAAAAAAAAAGGGNQTLDPSLLTPELLGMYTQLLIQQQEQERQRLQLEQQAQFQKLQQLQNLLQQQ